MRHEPTSFVGRDDELAAVREAVARGRVVTLTGPGGVGKTRIALRAMQQLKDDFPDGISMAELSGLRDPELLPNAVACAVGLPETTAQQPMDQLIEYFAGRRALLVLDTCEHLVSAMAMFADSLVCNSAHLVLMLTSRQAVALPGEYVLPIPPMPEPDAGADETTNDTLALFTARAQAAESSFVLSNDNRAEVIALCRRLDGIPLAIELAAVHLRTMSLEQILGRVEDRFGLLAGTRSAQARHQTLRATINWSHALCSPAERKLWARLSVFAGGFTLAAVEQVCADGELEGHDVIGLLLTLVDKSVVQRITGVEEQRYRMLDTVREFGAERLQASGRAELYARRHQDFFLRMAVRAGQEWFGDDQVQWSARLAEDLDNFRVAMDFAAAHPGEEAALRLVNNLWGLWLGRSRLTEARRWIDRALATEPTVTAEHGMALWYAAYFGLLQADPVAGEMAARCRAAAERLDDDFLRARAAYVEALALTLWGEDQTQALGAIAQARQQAQATEDLFVLTTGHLQVSALLTGSGDPAAALAELEQGLHELASLPRERFVRNYLLVFQVPSLLALGDLDRARELGRDALACALDQGETMCIASAVEYLSWTAVGLGQHRLAATLLGGAASLWNKVGRLLWGIQGLIDLHEEVEASLMLELGAEQFTAVYGRGGRLDLPELVALAIGHAEDQEPGSPRLPREDGSALGPLTPREREVAHLIAEGLSNRQIAERLVISKRTADAHVEHILTKLGFNSRTQVAAMIGSLKPDLEPTPTRPN
ncbi:helix-turn-helix transcriptional regulator [Actinomadura rupiterrae]|uniref:helix-turn-helix transcriptional regulator n=1 Tax=Actinomadura rupiterrae TaxID=559627 RepID=UPI0020A3D73D|nr:LuxR C-terminal-related transcriptional regulator [Actinomadura rupiterrae]MCP2335181.1 non-specific serine/threonine protein kinase [Actinomadura rupiterrae]